MSLKHPLIRTFSLCIAALLLVARAAVQERAYSSPIWYCPDEIH